VLKALSLGAAAVSGGRLHLYALAAAGRAGVERIIPSCGARSCGMKLMGVRRLDNFSRDNLRWQ
jgi:L-lactate dehydrogenase (cytochrome)